MILFRAEFSNSIMHGCCCKVEIGNAGVLIVYSNGEAEYYSNQTLKKFEFEYVSLTEK